MAGVIKSFLGNKVYLKPQGFLDSHNASLIITAKEIKQFENKNIKFVSIDFSKVVSANMNALRFLNDVFESLYKKDIECGIFNVSKHIYQMIMRLDNRFFNL